MTIDETIVKEKANAEKLRKIIEAVYDGGISIEALFCDDTSAIKEAYERLENDAKECEQLAEWLEELKCYKNDNDFSDYADRLHKIAFNSGYNKAIDDLIAKCENAKFAESDEISLSDVYTGVNSGFSMAIHFAEQLKAGGKNE